MLLPIEGFEKVGVHTTTSGQQVISILPALTRTAGAMVLQVVYGYRFGCRHTRDTFDPKYAYLES